MARLLYLVSEDWYFLSHRLPMARAARAAGYEVHVATRVVKGGAAIVAEGFQLHPMEWRRGSVNLFDFLYAVGEVRRIYRALAPDLVHQVALWPTIVGSVAGIGLPVKRLSALAGLGFAFTSNSPKARTVRGILRPLLRLLLNGPHSAVLVQNPDDEALMTAVGIDRSRLFVIPGSGVDTDHLQPLPEPAGPITMAYVGRLLADKGLRALLSAQATLTARGEAVRLLIAGDADPGQPRLHSTGGSRNMAAPTRCRTARSCPRHSRCLGQSAYCRPAVAARGPTDELAGGGRLRAAHRRHGCSRLP